MDTPETQGRDLQHALNKRTQKKKKKRKDSCRKVWGGQEAAFIMCAHSQAACALSSPAVWSRNVSSLLQPKSSPWTRTVEGKSRKYQPSCLISRKCSGGLLQGCSLVKLWNTLENRKLVSNVEWKTRTVPPAVYTQHWRNTLYNPQPWKMQIK